jgi:hypothetical protein
MIAVWPSGLKGHRSRRYMLRPRREAAGQHSLQPPNRASGPRPDGEVLAGQYAIAQPGASGFRSIYASAFAPLAMPGVVYGRSRMAERSSPCHASLVGDHGTLMQCEFYYDNVFRHGYVGCSASHGALFFAPIRQLRVVFHRWTTLLSFIIPCAAASHAAACPRGLSRASAGARSAD